MNFASRMISFFVFSTAALVMGQTLPSQGSGDLDRRDLEPQPVTGEPTVGRVPVVPRGYALLVSVAHYEKLDPEDYLRFPESDARALYRVLISKEGGSFPAENVHMLTGRKATLQNLQHELEDWLSSAARPQDQVVVYFAGHGFLGKDGQGYLALWDIDPTSPETTGYPMNRLGKMLADHVKAHWKLVLLDACHSAKITPETSNQAVDEQISRLPKGFPGGFLVFSATRAQEKSYEDPRLSNGFGVFTFYLKQGLEGQADRQPCDGVITADELIDYVRSGVREYTMQRGVIQTPTEYGDFSDYMVLSGTAACHDAATLPTSVSAGSLVIETNMDGVEIYLDDKLVGRLDKGKPLRQPGLSSGAHTVKGVRDGYEPVTKEVQVIPGQEKAVTLRIQYRRVYKPLAVDLVDQGERLLSKKTSGFNPLLAIKAKRQTESDLMKARLLFKKALREDPRYPIAAYDLAKTCQQLSDSEAMLKAFQQAVQLDLNYVDARVDYAGALIEQGDSDEAIRQLTDALQLAPDDAQAYSLLSRAYLDKGAWDLTIAASQKAIVLNPLENDAYLWMGDALRRQAPGESDPSRRQGYYIEAVDSYRKFLSMTDFSAPVREKVVNILLGIGSGAAHADREASYVDERSFAFMGLCECEDKLGNLLRASDYCQRAIKYDPEDAIAYFLLGNVYRNLFNQRNDRNYLVFARVNYAKMIRINPDLEYSHNACDYIQQIDRLIPQLK